MQLLGLLVVDWNRYVGITPLRVEENREGIGYVLRTTSDKA